MAVLGASNGAVAAVIAAKSARYWGWFAARGYAAKRGATTAHWFHANRIEGILKQRKGKENA